MKKENLKSKKVISSSPVAATHITRGNVFEDLGFSQEESRTLQLKTDAHTALMQLVRDKKYTQKELSILLDQPQPRISELLNGKISKLSLEKLVDYLERLGAHTSLKVETRNVKRLVIQRHSSSAHL
jgi:predicted XRE-type DNA-binding protein